MGASPCRTEGQYRSSQLASARWIVSHSPRAAGPEGFTGSRDRSPYNPRAGAAAVLLVRGPEPVRVDVHAALAAAAGGHLVDAGGGQRLPVAGSEPQLGPPGLGAPGAGAQVPVQAPGGLVADLDDPILAALAANHKLPLPQVDVTAAQAGHLGQPDAGRSEHRDDRGIAPLGKAAARAHLLEPGQFLGGEDRDQRSRFPLATKMRTVLNSGQQLSVDAFEARYVDGLNPPLRELWSRIRSGDRNPPLDLVREGITASDADVVRIFVDVVAHLRPSAVVDNTVEIVASALDDLRRLGSHHDVLCTSPLFARLLFLGTPDPVSQLRVRQLARTPVPSLDQLDVTDVVKIRVHDEAFALWRARLSSGLERAASPRTAPAWQSQSCHPLPQMNPGWAPAVAEAGRPEPAGKYADRARRHHAIMHDLLNQGRGLREIARHLGWGLHTVQRYARAATWQELADGGWQQPRPGKLDPFKPHLDQRTGQGCGNGARLFREIKALGYAGSYSVVRGYLDQRRPARTPLPPAPPTVRDVTGWLTRHPDSLTDDERPQLQALLDRCPELRAADAQVRAFAVMLARLTGQDLPQWISGARAAGLPGLSSFAKGLEQDLDAVTAGLTTRWNSGPVKGTRQPLLR